MSTRAHTGSVRASLATPIGVILLSVLLVPGETRPAGASAKPEFRGGQVFRDCPECPEMVVIPAGSFTMGSPAEEEGRLKYEGPQHMVTIQRAFALGRFEVTRAEFAAFVQASGHDPSGCHTKERHWERDEARSWRDPGFSQSDDHPAVCVTWGVAKRYVEWLSATTGEGYRLPSESEWEYAARAETTTARYWGDNPAEACEHANVADQTLRGRYPDYEKSLIHRCEDESVYTAAVGQFGANAFGLFDMLGNVWEWTEDCPSLSYSDAPADGSVSENGLCTHRVIRGGSWYNGSPGFVRSAYRHGIAEGLESTDVGLRVARTLP